MMLAYLITPVKAEESGRRDSMHSVSVPLEESLTPAKPSKLSFPTPMAAAATPAPFDDPFRHIDELEPSDLGDSPNSPNRRQSFICGLESPFKRQSLYMMGSPDPILKLFRDNLSPENPDGDSKRFSLSTTLHFDHSL